MFDRVTALEDEDGTEEAMESLTKDYFRYFYLFSRFR